MNNTKILFKKLSVVHSAAGYQKETGSPFLTKEDIFVWNAESLLQENEQIPIQNILIF